MPEYEQTNSVGAAETGHHMTREQSYEYFDALPPLVRRCLSQSVVDICPKGMYLSLQEALDDGYPLGRMLATFQDQADAAVQDELRLFAALDPVWHGSHLRAGATVLVAEPGTNTRRPRRGPGRPW